MFPSPATVGFANGIRSTPSTRSRRDFLYAGWLGGAGLTLGHMLQIESRADGNAPADRSAPTAKAKSVIHIYLQGGFPHMDSFDPKPDAPPEYGEF